MIKEMPHEQDVDKEGFGLGSNQEWEDIKNLQVYIENVG